MNAAGYTRVSIAEQAEDGFSLDSQDHNINAFAQSKGMEVVHIYQDAGISGTRSDRPALEQLLHDAEQGRFDVVIVHSIDRFYRDLQGLLRALNHLQQHGVAFISISENLDFTTPWGKLALAVLGSLAEIYIDRLSEDTRRGKRQRARNGLWNGSPPLGYCRGNCATCTAPNGPGYCPNAGQPDRSQDKGLVLHPIESEAVKLAFEWYATGKYSDGQIAEMLNAHEHTLPDGTIAQFRSKGRPGVSDPMPLSKDSIREVLQNPVHTGVVPYYGKQGPRRKEPISLFPGKHPALVSQDVFDRCQEVRALNYRRPRKRGSTPSRIYPLSGILRCGGCGSKMRAQRGGSGNQCRYACAGRLQHITDCKEPAVHAVDIEEQIVDYLDSLPFPEDWEPWVYQQLDPEWDEQEIQRREQGLQGRLARAVELYLAGDIDKTRYEAEKRACEDQIADLRPGEIRDIIPKVESLIDFRSLWEESSPLNRKRLIRLSLVSAQIRKQRLVSVEPSPLLYPILRNLTIEGGFYSGSDGYGSTEKNPTTLRTPPCGPIL
jgi:DNA invertase Pin-like site-specific DNA recombinase